MFLYAAYNMPVYNRPHGYETFNDFDFSCASTSQCVEKFLKIGKSHQGGIPPIYPKNGAQANQKHLGQAF